ncbi:MAG: Flp pilus assembly protein CpaB [Planctomycetaceae bacterium]
MKLTPWMLTVAAFGIIAVLAVGFLFKKLMAAPVVEVKPPEARILPMAITEIEPGTVITRAHVGNGRAKAGETLPEDTFLSLDGVIGRIAKEKITSAVPLRGSMFYAPGDFPDLKVSPGKQAVVVKVSETTAVLSQKMKPEQHVDVLLTVDNFGAGDATRLQSTGGSVGGDSIGSTSNSMTATLFKGVKILAISRGYTTTALQGGESHNVTLELDEEQTRIISLAQRKGEIDLVYNEGGEEGDGIEINPSEKDRITLKEILGLKDPAPKEKPFKTEHYRGGGRSRTYFEDGEMIDGYGNGGSGDTDGSRLQSTGGSVGGWSTDTKPEDRQKNVAQKAGVNSDL